jgi:hypothetical protein
MNEHDIDRESDMAKQTGYTKGPWHIGMKPGPMIYGPLGEQVADLRGGVMLEDAEDKANARLIALAPELVEVLREVRADYRGRNDEGELTEMLDALLARIGGEE